MNTSEGLESLEKRAELAQELEANIEMLEMMVKMGEEGVHMPFKVYPTNNPSVFIGQREYADGEIVWTLRALEGEQ